VFTKDRYEALAVDFPDSFSRVECLDGAIFLVAVLRLVLLFFTSGRGGDFALEPERRCSTIPAAGSATVSSPFKHRDVPWTARQFPTRRHSVLPASLPCVA
jgi:hypothetical protein